MIVKNKLLNFKNKYIYQDNDCFLFSLDSVLLANFVTIKLSDKKIYVSTKTACSSKNAPSKSVLAVTKVLW